MTTTALGAGHGRTPDLTSLFLDQVRLLSDAVAAIDKRQATHEAVCLERHSHIDESLDDIKGLIRAEAAVRLDTLVPVQSAVKTLNSRAWAAMGWLTGSLAVACATLVVLVITGHH